MRNLNVRVKLIVGFALVTALAILVGVVGISSITNISAKDTELFEFGLQPIVTISEVNEEMAHQRILVRDMAIHIDDTALVQDAIASLDESLSVAKGSLDSYRATMSDPQAIARFDESYAYYVGDYTDYIHDVCALATAGDADGIYQQLVEHAAPITVMADTFNEVKNLRIEQSHEIMEGNNATSSSAVMLQLLFLLITAIAALFLCIYISRMITRPLRLMAQGAEQLANLGKLDYDASFIQQMERYSTSKDETGGVLRAFMGHLGHIMSLNNSISQVAGGDLTVNVDVLSPEDSMSLGIQKMVNNLNEMFEEISGSTLQVSSGARQIADGAQSLAQGSTEQAAAVEELSTSISDVARKTKENADQAQAAADLGNVIKLNAEKGSEQMGQMMQAVGEINEASQNINRVIKAIDDIAFQTNILALNAAVEAARAGQHGKGFAVVAEEVRSLAAKSAAAAKDTGSLIANSIEKAELGAQIANETSSSLSEIVSGINQSSQIVSDIAQSSVAQTAAIDQINTGIDQVAQVIQQNSATAEESASASEEMSSQAGVLEELMGRFQLKGGHNRLSGGRRIPEIDMHVRADEESYPIASGDSYGKY